MTSVEDRLAQVEPYLKAQFQLIPVRARTRIPARSGWTTDPPLPHGEARGWIRRGFNLGVRTGSHANYGPGNWIVVDADLKHGARVQHELDALDLPDTWKVETGGGGLHLYYLAPDDVQIANSVSKIGWKIDIRGHHGFVVAAGSIHPSGRMYSWVKGCAPGECGAARLPAELCERLRAPRQVTIAPHAPDAVDMSLVRSGRDPFADIPGVEEGTRNDTCYRLALRGLRVTDADMVSVRDALLRWNARCSPPDDEKSVLDTLESARKAHAKQHPEHFEERRPIVWIGDDMLQTVSQAEAVLVDAYQPGHPRAIYARGGVLVHAVPDSHSRLKVVPLKQPTLRELLSSAARFRIEGRKGSVMPPHDIVAALLSRGHWQFQPLQGICSTPFMRPDGTVAYAPGYDAETGYLGDFARARPELNGSTPGQEGAAQAAGRLLEPIADFPFVTESHRAAALSLVLTLLARRAIRGDVPLYAIRSHTPGSGKGLLTKVLVLMGTGQRPAMGMPSGNAEETRKRLFATALAGDPVVVFDNEEGTFGSSALSACLTSTVLEDRVLGQSRTARVPWNAVAVATGNNLSFRKDQARRTLAVDLDPQVERPEQRAGWKHPDLLRHVDSILDDLIGAGLVVLKAHAQAGRPVVSPQAYGGFESWNAVVRQAILWAGLPDPLGVRKQLIETDDADEAVIHDLLETWVAIFGEAEVAVRDLLQTRNVELAECLAALCGDRNVNARTIGYELRRVHGRILQGRRLQRGARTGGRQRWRVVTLSEPT